MLVGESVGGALGQQDTNSKATHAMRARMQSRSGRHNNSGPLDLLPQDSAFKRSSHTQADQ